MHQLPLPVGGGCSNHSGFRTCLETRVVSHNHSEADRLRSHAVHQACEPGHANHKNGSAGNGHHSGLMSAATPACRREIHGHRKIQNHSVTGGIHALAHRKDGRNHALRRPSVFRLPQPCLAPPLNSRDRKSTRLNSSH